MKAKKHVKPGTLLVLGFLLIILLGAFLLYLPISKKEISSVTFLDTLFISVSSVCVTGLTTIDIADNFTITGRIIQCMLIQLGGLGFATIAVFLLSFFAKNVSLSSMNLAKEALNYDSSSSVINLVRRVIVYAITIEVIGAFLLFFPYLKVSNSVFKASGFALYHSISAFNNAGFDLNGNLSSLAIFEGNIYVNIVISFLILLGGLGFFVMQDVMRHRRWIHFSFHTKIVLVMTVSLVLSGMLMLLIGGTDILNAFFLSVTSRTAGFSTIDLRCLSNTSLLVIICLMFIGANPGSTGGGIKTTTFFAMIVMMVSVITGKKPTAFKRRIPLESILKAFTLFCMAIFAVIIGTLGIMAIEESKFSFLEVLFEVVSALATVGLSMSLTPSLELGSKIILMVIMFIGRLGPLTIAAFFTGTKRARLEYIEEHVLIG